MNHTEEIYSAAKARSASQLLALQARGLSLDEVLPNEWPLTVAGKLAEEGDDKSVLFLLEHGANIHWMGYGAGRGGIKQQKLAELLRRAGADVDWIARGASEAGNKEYALFLYEEHNANLDYIVAGAVKSGDITFAKSLHTKGGVHYKYAMYEACRNASLEYIHFILSFVKENINEVLHYGWLGAAMTQNNKDVMRILGEPPTQALIMGELAKQGCFHSEYFDIDDLSQYSLETIYGIAINAALSGHIDIAEQLRINYSLNKENLIRAAIQGGHFDYGKQLSQSNLSLYQPYLIQGALVGHHYEFLGQNIAQKKIAMAEIIKEMDTLTETWDVTFLLSHLLKIEYPAFRESLLITGLNAHKFDQKYFEYALEASNAYHTHGKKITEFSWSNQAVTFFQVQPEGTSVSALYQETFLPSSKKR